MRYTTIIDITEMPLLYRNINVRLVYLHLVLKSGYHDYNRDIIDISIRQLAAQVNLTISAVRHALKILVKAQLLTKEGDLWKIKKWIIQESITPRVSSVKQKRIQDANKAREDERINMQREYNERQKSIDSYFEQGKTPFMVYYESLLQKAQQGDLESQKLVKTHYNTYQAHKKSLEENTNHIKH